MVSRWRSPSEVQIPDRIHDVLDCFIMRVLHRVLLQKDTDMPLTATATHPEPFCVGDFTNLVRLGYQGHKAYTQRHVHELRIQQQHINLTNRITLADDVTHGDLARAARDGSPDAFPAV